MVLRERLYTAEDLHELEQRPENADKRFELIKGEIYEVPTASPKHGAIGSNFVYYLKVHVMPSQLGYVFGDSCQYDLPNGDVVIPDVSFVSKARVPTLPDRFTTAPDLAIEIVSPSNRPRAILDKVESCLESGTRMVWGVYPDERVIDVWQSLGPGELRKRKFDLDATLDGGDVLPGFTLAVRDIFSV